MLNELDSQLFPTLFLQWVMILFSPTHGSVGSNLTLLTLFPSLQNATQEGGELVQS